MRERKQVAEMWIPAAKKAGVFAIIHIGATSIAESRELAQHAEANGADAIAAVPPFYEVIFLNLNLFILILVF